MSLYDLSPDEAEAMNLFRRIAAPLRGHSGPSLADLAAVLQTILMELRIMSETFSSEISKLQADVAAQSTVIASATTAFQGLAAQLAAAEAAAKNAGASAEQIAAVTAVRTGLEANTAALAAAIPANTPAAATPAAPADPSAPQGTQPTPQPS